MLRLMTSKLCYPTFTTASFVLKADVHDVNSKVKRGSFGYISCCMVYWKRVVLNTFAVLHTTLLYFAVNLCADFQSLFPSDSLVIINLVCVW